LAGLAGCTEEGKGNFSGDGGDSSGSGCGSGSTSFKVAGGYIKKTQCWDCLTPGSMF
jgi:hypothetical protein